MEFKFAHIILFFLLATSFETLMARKVSEGPQVIEELKSIDKPKCEGRLNWPELHGVQSNIVKVIIEYQNPLITDFPILLNGSPPPTDFSCNRVILYLNLVGNVIQLPVVG